MRQSDSWAARHQPAYGRGDVSLTMAARREHPTSRHWWGWRNQAGGSGAYCFLCNRIIAAYAAGREWPNTSLVAIMEHRAWHLANERATTGNSTAGMMPAGG